VQGWKKEDGLGKGTGVIENQCGSERKIYGGRSKNPESKDQGGRVGGALQRLLGKGTFFLGGLERQASLPTPIKGQGNNARPITV